MSDFIKFVVGEDGAQVRIKKRLISRYAKQGQVVSIWVDCHERQFDLECVTEDEAQEALDQLDEEVGNTAGG